MKLLFKILLGLVVCIIVLGTAYFLLMPVYNNSQERKCLQQKAEIERFVSEMQDLRNKRIMELGGTGTVAVELKEIFYSPYKKTCVYVSINTLAAEGKVIPMYEINSYPDNETFFAGDASSSVAMLIFEEEMKILKGEIKPPF